MFGSRAGRGVAGGALVVALSACAANPTVLERHDHFLSAPVEAAADRSVCPVVVSNATDEQLDARYLHGGVPALLGLIPAGRSLSFGVLCDGGPIEAFAVSNFGGLLGGPQEYRTVARLDRSRATQLRFAVTDRVR